jgi:hypothetical protein
MTTAFARNKKSVLRGIGVGNGATATSSTETGAYTLGSFDDRHPPGEKPGARYWVPSENEWYKAAYYDPNKSGSGVGGYWSYATQSDTAPSRVTANELGNGSAGSTGNFANYQNGAQWILT